MCSNIWHSIELFSPKISLQFLYMISEHAIFSRHALLLQPISSSTLWIFPCFDNKNSFLCMNVQNFDQTQNPPSSYYMHPRENPARPWLMEQKLALMELSYEEMSKNKSEFVGVIQIPNYHSHLWIYSSKNYYQSKWISFLYIIDIVCLGLICIDPHINGSCWPVQQK